MRATHLRCEYRTSPLTIHTPRPRLSWELADHRVGARQTAWQVVVATRREEALAGRGDLWDSGRVEGDRCSQVAYAGAPLTSRQVCWWSVRVWDQDDAVTAWAAPARWAMGLLEPADWTARWIGYDVDEGEPYDPSVPYQASNAYDGTNQLYLPPPPYLRGDFALDAEPVRAVVYATALGLYEVRLNGQKVGEDQLAPGWTDYERRVPYQAYEVTPLLRQGANALGAILADGWYAGYVAHRPRHLYGDQPRLRVQLEVEFADGRRQVFGSDESWRAAYGPTREADLLHGEAYDARLEQDGWDRHEFDASGWSPVAVSDLTVALDDHHGVPVRIVGRATPQSINPGPDGTFIVDFGLNLVGVVLLRVNGPAGTRLTLRHAERLNDDGSLDVRSLRAARATDTYVLKGGGVEGWRPRFTFHGFRYVEVAGLPGEPTSEMFTAFSLGSDNPSVGFPTFGHEVVKAVNRNVRNGMRGNWLEVPTDCPQRDERMGWGADAQVYLRTATCQFDVAAFLTKWSLALAEAQLEDGAYPVVAPSKPHPQPGDAAWGDVGIMVPWTLYWVYGDTRVVEERWDGMSRWIEHLRRNSQGLIRGAAHGDWLGLQPDGTTDAGSPTPHDVFGTAFFAQSVGLMARMAAAIGRDAEAEQYTALRQDIDQAFNQAFVDSDGRIKGDTQACYALALSFDLLPEALRPAAAAHLVEAVARAGYHPTTGLVATAYLLPALSRFGHHDVACRLITSDSYPSWGYMAKHGATTMWERWDSWTDSRGVHPHPMNSYNHPALGAVGEWLYRYLGGIDAEAPGYARVRIQPGFDPAIRYAAVGCQTPRGQVFCNWWALSDHLDVAVHLPPSTPGTLVLPSFGAAPTVMVDGRPFLQGGQAVETVPGVTLLGCDERTVQLAVTAGRYAVKVPFPDGALPGGRDAAEET